MVTEQSLSIPAQRRGLLVMRVLYFFYFAGLGAYWTYLNVYYKEMGLSGTQIGLVNTLSPLVSIFAATMWGIINDRLGQPRLIMRITIPGTILSCLGLSAVTSYLLIILFSCLMSLFISATIPLMDNTTLRLLGDRREKYGQYRMTGSFGFILSSLGSGYLYDITGLRWIFYVYAAIMVLFLVASTGMPSQRVFIGSSASVLGGLGQMVRQPAWMVFAISALLLWISNNGVMNFIGVTIQEMGGTSRLIGLMWMTSAIIEIPILFASDRLLRRFGSTRLLIVAFISFTLRGILFAVMPTPEWTPAISILGGLSMSLYMASAVNYANDSAPDHLKSTAQGLLFSIMNLGGMAGSLSSGWVYDNVGFRGLFWITAAIAFAGLVVFITGRLRFGQRGAGKLAAAQDAL